MSEDIADIASRAVLHAIGHEEAETHIASMVASGKLPHAWLISGPRGIGKATLAHRFARFLLATPVSDPNQETMFGDALPAASHSNLDVAADHPVLTRIVSGGHGDLKLVQQTAEKQEIVVSDVRELGQFLSLTPTESSWRVVIIDSADNMNRNAANAILKLLEEPPKQAVILLVSHSPGRLLPTIRSRCHHLPLTALSSEQEREVLQDYISGYDEGDIAFACAISEGSPGVALELLSSGGRALYQQMLSLLTTLPKIHVEELESLAGRIARKEHTQAWKAITVMLGYFLGKVALSKASGERFEVVIEEETTVAGFFHDHYTVDQLAVLWEKTQHIIKEAEGLHMDRKATLLQLVHMMSEAA